MADVMLPLFDNMPRVLLVVKDDEAFHTARPPLAVYSYPRILINPTHPPTSSFNDLKGTICHELIHAWLSWKGLDRKGEFLDEHHNEWFVKKALEINKLNIDGLKVDLEFALTTPEAVQIYNRLGGTWTPPSERAETSRIDTPELRTSRIETELAGVRRNLIDILGLSKNDSFLKFLLGSFLVVIAGLFLSRARVISQTVAGYVWITWAVGGFIWMSIEGWKELTSRRTSNVHIFRKKIMSEPGYKIIVALTIGSLLLYALIVTFR